MFSDVESINQRQSHRDCSDPAHIVQKGQNQGPKVQTVHPWWNIGLLDFMKISPYSINSVGGIEITQARLKMSTTRMSEQSMLQRLLKDIFLLWLWWVDFLKDIFFLCPPGYDGLTAGSESGLTPRSHETRLKSALNITFEPPVRAAYKELDARKKSLRLSVKRVRACV